MIEDTKPEIVEKSEPETQSPDVSEEGETQADSIPWLPVSGMQFLSWRQWIQEKRILRLNPVLISSRRIQKQVEPMMIQKNIVMIRTMKL